MSRERAYAVCFVLRLLVVAAVAFVCVRGCIGLLNSAADQARSVHDARATQIDRQIHVGIAA